MRTLPERKRQQPLAIGDATECQQDVRTDLDQARSMLEAAGQERCVHCLQVKTDLIGEITNCQPTAAQNQQVFDACDLDPDVDYDQDGTANNDDDEACAGLP